MFNPCLLVSRINLFPNSPLAKTRPFSRFLPFNWAIIASFASVADPCNIVACLTSKIPSIFANVSLVNATNSLLLCEYSCLDNFAITSSDKSTGPGKKFILCALANLSITLLPLSSLRYIGIYSASFVPTFSWNFTNPMWLYNFSWRVVPEIKTMSYAFWII